MTKNYIIAIVGMAGTGKSVVTSYISNKVNFETIHFGNFTMLEMKKRELFINPENEKKVREQLREKLGMAAYAILGIPEINSMLYSHKNVALDGLYSMSEYELLREEYKEKMKIVAVCSHKYLRLKRLKERKFRSMSQEEVNKRDLDEIKIIEKGGPIALADFTILNNSTLEELYSSIDKILNYIINDDN